MRYFHHPESSCTFEQDGPLESSDGLVEEIDLETFVQLSLEYGEPMSIETLLAANIKAVEANTEALTSFAAAVGAAVATGKKAGAKDKTTTATTAADPAATSAAPAGAAAGSAAGATAVTPGAVLPPTHPLAMAVQAFAKAHGREPAITAVNKFGGEGRASNIKPIDWEKATAYITGEHKRLDGEKAALAAAAKPAGEDSLI